MSAPVFPRKVLAAWITATVLAFVTSLYFMGHGEDAADETVTGPSVFSRSAVGYAALAQVLERLGHKVARERAEASPATSAGAVTIVAEPWPAFTSREELSVLDDAATVLLILPKWHGPANGFHRGWITDARLVSDTNTAWALKLGIDGGKVVRRAPGERWRENRLGITPTISDPVQLIQSDRLTPIVASADGMLIGERREGRRRIWILADPDVMANHGLAREENAAFAMALIKALGGSGASAVVFANAGHRLVVEATHAAVPLNPLRIPFDPRFLPATLQSLLAVALLLWAAVARFGAPEPARPALDAGKQGLIENAARLLTFAGHHRLMARRYVEATIREVARTIHAPRSLGDRGLVDWLGRASRGRGVKADCAAIYGRAQDLEPNGADAAASMLVARDIYRWKQEIIDGPSRNPGDRRGDSPRSAQGGGRPG